MSNELFSVMLSLFKQLNSLRQNEIENQLAAWSKETGEKKLRTTDATVIEDVYSKESSKTNNNIYKDIVQELGKEKRSTISQAVSRLVHDKYLLSKKPSEGRQPIITLTTKGRRLGYRLHKINEFLIIKAFASENDKLVASANDPLKALFKDAVLRLTECCKKRDDINIYRACIDADARKGLNTVRFYDYLIGGQFFLPIEKQFADELLTMAPHIGWIAQSNRAFTRRAVKFLAQQHITQFIDIGAGLPSFGATHEILAAVLGNNYKILYVDSDPYIVNATKYLLSGNNKNIEVMKAKLEDAGAILERAKECGMKLSERVAIIVTAVIHFIQNLDDAKTAIKQLCDGVSKGSCFVISHLVEPEVELTEEEKKKREQGIKMYSSLVAPLYIRSKEDILSIFTDAGLDFLPPEENEEPNIVYAPHWRSHINDEYLFNPSSEFEAEKSRFLVGVGQK